MKNLRELFTLYPLGCESFGAEWLRRWEGIGRLLQKPAFIESRIDGKRWFRLHTETRPVARCILWVCNTAPTDVEVYGESIARRVALLDGTVVYEWGPK